MRERPILLTTLLILLLASPAMAGMQQIPFEQLVRSAPLIVVGEVTDAKSELVEGGKRISTRVTVEVRERWKGSSGGRVTVRVGGGRVGDVVMSESTAPVLEPGTTVVLFLEPRNGEYAVTGDFQGAFRVKTDEILAYGRSEGSLAGFRERVARALEARR